MSKYRSESWYSQAKGAMVYLDIMREVDRYGLAYVLDKMKNVTAHPSEPLLEEERDAAVLQMNILLTFARDCKLPRG